MFLSCFGDECGERKIATAQSVGGTKSYAGQWPWLVSLHYSSSKNYFCGSSLINNKMLVTGKKFIFLKC